MLKCVRLSFIPFVALSMIILASCSSNDRIEETGANISGSVKYKGKPVVFSLVIAAGGNRSSQGETDDKGNYKFSNVPLGEITIAVNTDAGRGIYQGKVQEAMAPGPDGKSKKSNLPPFIAIPKKYHEPESSPLKTTVNKGDNTFNIDIKD